MIPPPSLTAIRAALRAHPARRTPFTGTRRRASVALILAGDETAPHLAFIRRAEHEGDPWSGHMALPGGRAEPTDADPEAVAERETEEEIGIVLRRCQLVATLEDLPVYRAGSDTGIVLSPSVYAIGPDRPSFRLSHEVGQAYWIPLAHLLDSAQATEMRFAREGRRLRYPGIAFDEEVIWGLTYRVLAAFFGLLGRTLPGMR